MQGLRISKLKIWQLGKNICSDVNTDHGKSILDRSKSKDENRENTNKLAFQSTNTYETRETEQKTINFNIGIVFYVVGQRRSSIFYQTKSQNNSYIHNSMRQQD